MREEMFGTRDLTFNLFHRRLSDKCLCQDIDLMEYCYYCKRPLVLIETAMDKGDGSTKKGSSVLEKLAHEANKVACVILYKVDDSQPYGIGDCRVRFVYPIAKQYKTLTYIQVMEMIEDWHVRCECQTKENPINPRWTDITYGMQLRPLASASSQLIVNRFFDIDSNHDETSNIMSNTNGQPPTTTAIAQRPTTQPIVPQNMSELLSMADMFYKSGMVPKNCNRPEMVAAVIQFGLEIGIKPAAAMNNIMIQNGRGTIWGDVPLALVRASGLLEEIEEWHDGDGSTRTAHCRVKRKGESKPRQAKYSVADAAKADLFMKGGKPGPWDKDTDHMLKLRVRGRLLRDVFTDVLNGLAIEEDSEETVHAASMPVQATVTSTTTNPPMPQQTQPPTPVVGVPMVDDGQLFDIKRHRKHWYLQNGFTSDEDPLAFTSWQSFLRGAFNVDSATKLTQEQAKELIALLIESDPHPLNAVMSGKDSESTATSQTTADGQPAAQTTATTTTNAA